MGTTKNALRNHRYTHHKGQKEISKNLPMNGGHDTIASDKDNIQNLEKIHIQDSNLEEKGDKTKMQKSLIDSKLVKIFAPNGQRLFQCSECQYVAKTKSNVQSHIKQNHLPRLKGIFLYSLALKNMSGGREESLFFQI